MTFPNLPQCAAGVLPDLLFVVWCREKENQFWDVVAPPPRDQTAQNV